MRTANFVIAALLGYASASESVLSPSQQERKAQLENDLNDLIRDIETTGDKLNKSLPAYEQADRENKRDLMNEARDLMDDAEEVNENYDDAFDNLGRNTQAPRGQHGLPNVSFTNKESIVDGFEGAIQSDVENTRDWISLGQERQAFEKQQEAKFKNEFGGDFNEIAQDVDQFARHAQAPMMAALNPAQQARKAAIEKDLDALLKDIEATGDKLNQEMPGYIQAD